MMGMSTHTWILFYIINMQLFKGFTFGIGFALGNRLVDYYKVSIDDVFEKVDHYIIITDREKNKKMN